jgi:hypothetical protein
VLDNRIAAPEPIIHSRHEVQSQADADEIQEFVDESAIRHDDRAVGRRLIEGVVSMAGRVVVMRASFQDSKLLIEIAVHEREERKRW